jgi:two-component system sensor histidine kinase QseC
VLAHLLALARASRAELDEAAQRWTWTRWRAGVVAEFAPAAHAAAASWAWPARGLSAVRPPGAAGAGAAQPGAERAGAHAAGTQVEVELDRAARWLQVSDDGRAQRGAASAARADSLQPLKLGLATRGGEGGLAAWSRLRAALALPAGRRGWRLVFPQPPQPLQCRSPSSR